MISTLIQPAFAEDKKASPQIKSGIPEGFEDLIDDSQTFSSGMADGDIFLAIRENGIELGNVIVRLEDTRLRFEDIDAFLNLLPALRNQTRLIEALGPGLDLESDQVCVIGDKSGCESPDQKTLRFLYEPNKQELDIFRPDNMILPPAPVAPSHESDIGAILSLNTRMTGYTSDAKTDLRGSASFRAILGRGRNSAFANGAITSGGDTQIYEAGVQTYRGDKRYAAGIIRAGVSDVAVQQDIIGVEIESVSQLRPNSGRTIMEPLTLLLSRDAYIDVLRGAEILYSGAHDAGSVEIPTRSFPAGSYNLTLRIRYDDSTTREETRFFTNSASGSAGQGWRLVAGQTRSGDTLYSEDQPARKEGVFFGAFEFHKTLAGRLNTRNMIGILDQTPFFDTQLSSSFQGIQTSATLRWSPDAYGVSARASGRIKETSVSTGIRYTDITNEDDETTSALTGYFGRQVQYDASLSRRVPILGGNASLYLRHFERERDQNTESTSSLGFNWNKSFDVGLVRTVATLGAQTDGDRSDVFFGVRLSQQNQRNSYAATARANRSWSNNEAEDRLQYSASASRRSAARSATQWRSEVSMRGDEESVNRLGVSGRMSNRSLSGNARLGYQPDEQRTNYSGGVQTALAISPAGFGLTSQTGTQSAVLITTSQDMPDLSVRVSGNSGERRVGKSGTMMPVRSFTPAQIRGRPASATSAVGGFGPVEVRAFPGNVVHVRADVKRETSVFGRLIDRHGAPMANLVASVGDIKFTTDTDGFFVADLPVSARSIEFSREAVAVCSIEITLSKTSSIKDLGDRICTANL